MINVKYKKDKTIIEELFIITCVRYLMERNPSSGPDSLRKLNELVTDIVLISGDYEKIKNRLFRLISISGISKYFSKNDEDLLKVTKILIKTFLKQGYIIPDYIYPLFSSLFDITATDEELLTEELSIDINEILNNIKSSDYFNVKNI